MGRKVWVPPVSRPLAPYTAGFESGSRSLVDAPSTAQARGVVEKLQQLVTASLYEGPGKCDFDLLGARIHGLRSSSHSQPVTLLCL
jgi:hypothetical protein